MTNSSGNMKKLDQLKRAKQAPVMLLPPGRRTEIGFHLRDLVSKSDSVYSRYKHCIDNLTSVLHDHSNNQLLLIPIVLPSSFNIFHVAMSFIPVFCSYEFHTVFSCSIIPIFYPYVFPMVFNCYLHYIQTYFKQFSIKNAARFLIMHSLSVSSGRAEVLSSSFQSPFVANLLNRDSMCGLLRSPTHPYTWVWSVCTNILAYIKI